jgi:hypothetical protein
LYSDPIQLTDTTTVKVAVYSSEGRRLGSRSTTYECRPLFVTAHGHILNQKDQVYWNPIIYFGNTLSFEMKSLMKYGEIHYTLDGSEPTVNSPLYQRPFSLGESATVRAQLYNVFGKKRGEEWKMKYAKVDYEDNLTKDKPVTASAQDPRYPPEVVVDGLVDRLNYWKADQGSPHWLTIDLEKIVEIKKIQVYPFWGDSRYYQYIVEVSPDEKKWTKVADMSHNTVPSTRHGFVHEFTPSFTRFIRITMLKNSANPGLHLVEVRAY